MNRSIIFLPIDLPKLELDRTKVLEYFFERRKIHQVWTWVCFKKLNQKIDPDLLKLFPDLDEKLRQLPFKDYDNDLHIDFRQQIVDVRPHQDPDTRKFGSAELGPTAYKTMIIRDALESFYVLPQSTNPDVVQFDPRPIEYFNPVYPVLPEDTNWFCINNHIGKHGAKMAPPSNIKIIMFFSGPLDEQKHLELIERSKEKYKDFIIYN